MLEDALVTGIFRLIGFARHSNDYQYDYDSDSFRMGQ